MSNYQTVSNKITTLHEKSLQASILSSFFQGAISYEEYVEKATTSSIDQVLKSNDSIYVEFVWDTENSQNLYFDKEEHKVTNNKKETTVPFTSLAVEVKNNEAFDTVTVYVINATSSSRVSYYKIHTLAHQAELYKYILSLEIKGTL